MSRVLVIDDEPQIVRALSITLRANDYQVDAAPDGRRGIRLAAERHPDIVLLDLGLPDLEGVEVVQALRGWSPVPIIVLSGRAGSADKVAALDAGADDYVTKPFAMDELLARLRAALRRTGPEGSSAVLETEAFTADFASRQVSVHGQEVHLTRTEWQLLEALARHPGRLVTHRQLLTEVWGPGYENETQYLRVFVGQLRRKLEPGAPRPRHLLTEPGMGYRLQP